MTEQAQDMFPRKIDVTLKFTFEIHDVEEDEYYNKEQATKFIADIFDVLCAEFSQAPEKINDLTYEEIRKKLQVIT